MTCLDPTHQHTGPYMASLCAESQTIRAESETASGTEYGMPTTRQVNSLIDYVEEGDGGRHYRVQLTIDGETRDYWFSFHLSARLFVLAEVFGIESDEQ